MKKGKKRKTSSYPFPLESLPLTSAVSKFHSSYRAFFAVQEWLGNALDPTEWGWVGEERVLTPVFTDRPVALDSVLCLISCGCKTSYSSEKLCYCKRAGNYCTDMCTVCVGQLCKHSQPVEHSQDYYLCLQRQ